MYDDYDHRPRDERDYHRRRSPVSRDHQYRTRHGSSRSPRRTPPRAPRGDQPHRHRDSPDGYRHEEGRRDRSRDHFAKNDNYDDPYHRRKASPGYRRDARSPVSDRDRLDRDFDGNRGRRYRNSRGPSPYDSGDDGHYRDSSQRSGPGRPYHTLKLDDVPDRISPEEIDDAMCDLGAEGLVEVRIKADDRAGPRRCYAFAEFKYEDDAVEFLEKFYPSFELRQRNRPSIKIYIDYSRERRAAGNPEDWTCTMCHFENFSRRAVCKQCKAPRATENLLDVNLDGQSDECPQQAPSQFVVIRDLASSVNENSLANGIKQLYLTKEDEPKQPPGAKLKSTAPVGNTSGLGARPGSLSRVFMIRDKASEISCNYGFAEFSTLDDAKAAMAKYKATPQFTISAKPVTIAYNHAGVFVPHMYPDQDSKHSFASTHNSSLRLAYWNPSVYASELTLFNESLYEEKVPDNQPQRKDGEQSAAKDSKKRKADKELAAPNGKKTIAMAPQLAMWANKHAELHASKSATKEGVVEDGKGPATGSNAVGGSMKIAPLPAPTTSSVSYADLDQMCCLLCRRKFKSEPSLRRHEQLSDMHKSNLEDDGRKAKATDDLKALGKEPVTNYRDRAKERRLVHQQPTKPKMNVPKKAGNHSEKESERRKESAPTKPAMSKGAGLLAKMGWSKGDGLGAEGGGRTNIIETMAYAPGVGLGAQGGKLGDAAEEAARATKNDYGDFVTKAKDKARERYERMS